MFAHQFIRNAYLAGTPVAFACGAIGWFVVLRAEVFAADALSHVAFVGAIAAAVLGLDERAGLFALTLAAAIGLGAVGRRGRSDDVAIGISFAWILGIGVLLLAILATSPHGGSGITTANTLFGSIYSLSASAARVAALIAVLALAALAAVLRPLLAATLDAELAVVRGIPVRNLGFVFLALLAVITAESTQAVGTLLLLGLITGPAAAAHVLASNPYRGIALSGALAVAATWAGLALSYVVGSLPPSSTIIGFAAGFFAVASLSRRVRTARA